MSIIISYGGADDRTIASEEKTMADEDQKDSTRTRSPRQRRIQVAQEKVNAFLAPKREQLEEQQRMGRRLALAASDYIAARATLAREAHDFLSKFPYTQAQLADMLGMSVGELRHVLQFAKNNSGENNRSEHDGDKPEDSSQAQRTDQQTPEAGQQEQSDGQDQPDQNQGEQPMPDPVVPDMGM